MTREEKCLIGDESREKRSQERGLISGELRERTTIKRRLVGEELGGKRSGEMSGGRGGLWKKEWRASV